jgi:hypothetical protein
MLQRVQNMIRPARIFFSPAEALYGLQVEMAGWGLIDNYTTPNVLQTGSLVIITRDICKQRIARLIGIVPNIDERIFCSLANPYVLSRPVSYILHTHNLH